MIAYGLYYIGFTEFEVYRINKILRSNITAKRHSNVKPSIKGTDTKLSVFKTPSNNQLAFVTIQNRTNIRQIRSFLRNTRSVNIQNLSHEQTTKFLQTRGI